MVEDLEKIELEDEDLLELAMLENDEDVIRNVGFYSNDILHEFSLEEGKKEFQKKNYDFLKESARRGSLLIGKAYQVEKLPDELRTNEDIYWGVRVMYEHEYSVQHWGRVSVLIPENMFFLPELVFANGYDTKDEATKRRIRKSILRKYISDDGAKIQFVIKAIEKDKEHSTNNNLSLAIVGDRVTAMNILRDKNFFHHNRKRTDEEPITVKKGSKVECFVCRVETDYVVVSTLGLETSVKRFEFTNEQVDNCHKVAKVGQKYNMTVKDVKIDEETGTVHLKLTNRKLVLPKHVPSLRKGVIQAGTVIYPAGVKGVITVMLDCDVLCVVKKENVSGYQPLCVGDRVMCEITNILDYMVQGNAVRC